MGDSEVLAWRASAESGLDDRPRCDPRVLAVSYCGLTLAPWARPSSRLAGGVIWYPARASEDAQAYYVAHEVGHDLIAHAGIRLERAEEETEASRIGCALLLPRRAYLRDLRVIGWDVRALVALWPLASPWIHARRIAEVHEDAGVVASRWKRGRMVSRTRPGRATALERELARTHGVTAGDRVGAWSDEVSAVVVCEV